MIPVILGKGGNGFDLDLVLFSRQTANYKQSTGWKISIGELFSEYGCPCVHVGLNRFSPNDVDCEFDYVAERCALTRKNLSNIVEYLTRL